jgi:hypothetical protein
VRLPVGAVRVTTTDIEIVRICDLHCTLENVKEVMSRQVSECEADTHAQWLQMSELVPNGFY